MAHDVTLTRQAVSQHLQMLENAGLVVSYREGRYKYHRIDTAPLVEITKRWQQPSSPRSNA